MAQGDGSQYPILPISMALMVACYLFSRIVSTSIEYLYDLYLIRVAKIDKKDKELIEKRMKAGFKRWRQVFEQPKLEKFDAEEAKKRLAIVQSVMMERLESKYYRPYAQQNKVEKIEESQVDETRVPEETNDTSKERPTSSRKGELVLPRQDTTMSQVIKNKLGPADELDREESETSLSKKSIKKIVSPRGSIDSSDQETKKEPKKKTQVRQVNEREQKRPPSAKKNI